MSPVSSQTRNTTSAFFLLLATGQRSAIGLKSSCPSYPLPANRSSGGTPRQVFRARWIDFGFAIANCQFALRAKPTGFPPAQSHHSELRRELACQTLPPRGDYAAEFERKRRLRSLQS